MVDTIIELKLRSPKVSLFYCSMKNPSSAIQRHPRCHPRKLFLTLPSDSAILDPAACQYNIQLCRLPKQSSTPPRLSSPPLPAEYPCPGSLIILVPASRRIYPRPSHVPKLASTWLLAMASLATATHRSYPRPCFLTKPYLPRLSTEAPPTRATLTAAKAILDPPRLTSRRCFESLEMTEKIWWGCASNN